MKKNAQIATGLVATLAIVATVVTLLKPREADVPEQGGLPGADQATSEPAVKEARRGSGELAAPISAQALPPEGTPLAQSYPALNQLAQTGNRAAATRLFHELAHCIGIADVKGFAKEVIDRDMLPVQNPALFNALSPEQQARELEIAVGAQKSLDRAQQEQGACEDTEKLIEGGRIYAASLAAAKLGDEEAAACYVQGAYPFPGSWFETGDMDDYRRNARQLMEMGFQRGDWRMADMLANAYLTDAPTFSINTYMNMADRKAGYRLYHLLRFGAQGERADQVNRMLAFLKERSPDLDEAAATNWAKDAFDKYFSHSGLIPEENCAR